MSIITPVVFLQTFQGREISEFVNGRWRWAKASDPQACHQANVWIRRGKHQLHGITSLNVQVLEMTEIRRDLLVTIAISYIPAVEFNHDPERGSHQTPGVPPETDAEQPQILHTAGNQPIPAG